MASAWEREKARKAEATEKLGAWLEIALAAKDRRKSLEILAEMRKYTNREQRMPYRKKYIETFRQ